MATKSKNPLPFVIRDGVLIYHCFKYKWPELYWYSFNADAIWSEPPKAKPGDLDFQFDIRKLPSSFIHDLNIGGDDISEEEMRENHKTALLRAIAEGWIATDFKQDHD